MACPGVSMTRHTSPPTSAAGVIGVDVGEQDGGEV